MMLVIVLAILSSAEVKRATVHGSTSLKLQDFVQVT